MQESITCSFETTPKFHFKVNSVLVCLTIVVVMVALQVVLSVFFVSFI